MSSIKITSVDRVPSSFRVNIPTTYIFTGRNLTSKISSEFKSSDTFIEYLKTIYGDNYVEFSMNRLIKNDNLYSYIELLNKITDSTAEDKDVKYQYDLLIFALCREIIGINEIDIDNIPSTEILQAIISIDLSLLNNISYDTSTKVYLEDSIKTVYVCDDEHVSYSSLDNLDEDYVVLDSAHDSSFALSINRKHATIEEDIGTYAAYLNYAANNDIVSYITSALNGSATYFFDGELVSIPLITASKIKKLNYFKTILTSSVAEDSTTFANLLKIIENGTINY